MLYTLFLISVVIIFTVAILFCVHYIKKQKNKLQNLENEIKQTNEIIHTLLTSTNLNIVVSKIMENISKLKAIDSFYIYVIDSGNILRCIATKGAITTKGIPKFSFVLNENCDIINNVIRKKNYTIVLKENYEIYNKIDLKEFIILPLVVHNQTTGLIFAGNKNRKLNLNKEDINFLEIISNQASIALHNATLYSKIQELSVRDGLTGILNYRSFQEKIREQIELVKRYGHTLSLVIIDIDHFKNYNDKNGHIAGDICLKEVVEIIKQNIRKTDMVFRYGGEEFALILPATDKFGAFKVIENIREKIEKYPFEFKHSQPEGKLTISAGISNFPDDTQEVRELIDLADKTLYQAKQIGRNRVCVYKSGDLL